MIASGIAAEIPGNRSLKHASVDRLACLFRHWLGRLRRRHHAFGEALREEQMSRELDLLDPSPQWT
jgi:hypothetical protein